MTQAARSSARGGAHGRMKPDERLSERNDLNERRLSGTTFSAVNGRDGRKADVTGPGRKQPFCFGARSLKKQTLSHGSRSAATVDHTHSCRLVVFVIFRHLNEGSVCTFREVRLRLRGNRVEVR